jgi:hypothetical protein
MLTGNLPLPKISSLMPIDYKKYPKNWKTEIVPAIKDRDGHRCKFCGVPNYATIFRGIVEDGAEEPTEIYQFADGRIFQSSDGTEIFVGQGYLADVQPLSGNPLQKAIKIILTVAHLDHDINNNTHDNLAALCQRCHLRYDAEHHSKNSKANRDAKKAATEAKNGVLKLF